VNVQVAGAAVEFEIEAVMLDVGEAVIDRDLSGHTIEIAVRAIQQEFRAEFLDESHAAAIRTS